MKFIPLLLLPFIFGCSAIPKGGIVFSNKQIAEYGLKDLSSDYTNRYVRITTTLDSCLSYGGNENHKHGFEHSHSDTIFTNETVRPLGLSHETSAANHFHIATSTSQDIKYTSESNNDFDHVNWGIYQRQTKGRLVPINTIVGYVGNEIPNGWQLVSDRDSLFIVVSEIKSRDSVFQEKEEHNHNISHNHSWTSTQSNEQYQQTFQPSEGTIQTAAIVHQHEKTEGTSFSGKTDNERIELPQLQIRFIIATKDNKELPKGSVIGFKGQRLPKFMGLFSYGWKTVGVIEQQAINGKFLYSSSQLNSIDIVENEITHSHMYSHSHTVSTGKPDSLNQAYAEGKNQYISTKDHVHSGVIEDTSSITKDNHLPRYLNLFLIIKTK
ncbi:hypothetical protein [Mesoflavibacter zeaxanthinifaciens]|uniref:hypothetical protein n=1 Tax=Mesoflavibacter zeaxanthinifaciens TaxID=393060 RepID=UPI003A912BE0